LRKAKHTGSDGVGQEVFSSINQYLRHLGTAWLQCIQMTSVVFKQSLDKMTLSSNQIKAVISVTSFGISLKFLCNS